MALPKPTLGYPSRSAAVQALREQGWSMRRIAEEIGISLGTVSALDASAKRRREPRPAEVNGKTVLFPAEVLDRLRPHAARRGITPNELARRIVDVAIDECMIDAILDDELEASR
ncbi:hypothetical protein [Albimonas pacifica]|uniref:Homeodomain-like domain-containing protein n=1 Tax=Albimonas pacifica TaxID=1114924 RepID=A0A1I3HKM4_9RHOB|nr:hypothetical protein [Albimonas pacifica]SFI36183.1 hypothetical protein SAMN05216258_10645 [Albimonas pacifica]